MSFTVNDDSMKRYFLGDEVVDSVAEEKTKHPPSWHPSYIDYRVVGDGRSVWIMRKLYTWAIVMGRTLDEYGFEDQWCYTSGGMAKASLRQWFLAGCVGEPQHWTRNPSTGRRRPDGDASKEYIQR